VKDQSPFRLKTHGDDRVTKTIENVDLIFKTQYNRKTYILPVRECDFDVQVVCSRWYEDLENDKVLQKPQLLLCVNGQLNLASFSETKHTAFNFFVVVFGNSCTFFFPFFKRVFPLKG